MTDGAREEERERENCKITLIFGKFSQLYDLPQP